MSNSNNDKTNTEMCQPTMMDLYKLMTKCATKDDLETVSTRIEKYTNETNEKIQHIQAEVDNISTKTNHNNDRIEMLEASLEQMKQDQLKNNLCISGVPVELVNGENTSDIVIKIASKLNVEITKNQFSSYAVANNKFLIARFYNLKHKQTLQNKIRAKRSLMVEEVFGNKSNSQIYLNDHLTPYMNKLFLAARTAKKDGKLASATSHGGKIRARKSTNDVPITITCEKQLQTLIDMEFGDTSTESIQHDDDYMNTSASTSQQQTRKKTHTKKPKTKTNTTKTTERKQYQNLKQRPPNKNCHRNASENNTGTENRKRRVEHSEDRSTKKIEYTISQ